MTSAVRSAIDGAPEFQLEPPRPLRRQMPEAEPFPIEALGSILGPAAMSINETIQSPLALGGQSCLAAATLCVQGLADVRLPFNQTRPVSEFFVSVAESGERKSSADNFALAPISAFEEILRIEHRERLEAHEIQLATWTAEKKRITTNRELDLEGMGRSLEILGREPEVPRSPMITCPEPTFEGLTRLFADGRPSLGLFAAEGGQFLGGFGMAPEHRLKTAAALSNLWDGQPLRRVRAGDGNRILPHRRLSMHLMVQPNVSLNLLADPALKDQGLLSRLLVCFPTSTIGKRFWKEPSSEKVRDLITYNDRLSLLLKQPLPIREGTSNELIPSCLELTPSARNLWISFSDHLESEMAPGGHLEQARSFAAKAPEHAARLAGVLCLVEDPFAVEINEHHLACGINLTQHYLSEWLRLLDSSGIRPEVLEAEKLLSWLESWPLAVIGLPEVYQRGPNSIRDKKAAQQAMLLLEDHGWVQRVETGAYVGETFRRDAWQLVRP